MESKGLIKRYRFISYIFWLRKGVLMDSNMVLVNKYIVYIRDYKRYSLNTINGYSRDIRDFILFINNVDIRYVSDDLFR